MRPLRFRQTQLTELQGIFAIGKLAIGGGQWPLPQVGGLDGLCRDRSATLEKKGNERGERHWNIVRLRLTGRARSIRRTRILQTEFPGRCERQSHRFHGLVNDHRQRDDANPEHHVDLGFSRQVGAGLRLKAHAIDGHDAGELFANVAQLRSSARLMRAASPLPAMRVSTRQTRARNGGYRASTGAGMVSFVNRGTIWSRLATYHTIAAISTEASFTSSRMMRS